MVYNVYVPATMEMGDYRFVARASHSLTLAQDALWTYNHSRERDGLPPLKRMPRGTVYTRVE
jgi:hypothetical protein